MTAPLEVRHAINGKLVRFGRGVFAAPPGPPRQLQVSRLAATVTAGSAPTPFAGYGPIGSYKPDATTTGVRSGSVLTTHVGNIVAVAGQTIENLDIYGRILVGVPNVTVRNCRVRCQNGDKGTALIECFSRNASNLLVEDCTLIPDFPLSGASSTTAGGFDGVTGHDYTARRCHVANTIDGFGVFNTNNSGGPVNVVIEQNYVHDHCFISPDPGHSDNKTHNDGVQIQGGQNVSIRGNNFQAFCDPAVSQFGTFGTVYQANSVLQVTQGVATVAGVTYDSNWCDGGGASLNLAGVYANFGSVTNNRFGHNQRLQGAGGDTTYTILYNGLSVVSFAGNVYDDDSVPVLIRSNGS